MRFKKRDIVKIGKKSEFYMDDSTYNPKDVKGEIIEICDNVALESFSIRVKWNNGNGNGYRESDLRLVRRES